MLLVIGTAFLACRGVNAAAYLLDDPASPTSVVFDAIGGLFSVTNKADGFVWCNPTNGGGSVVQILTVSQANSLNLSAVAKGPGGAQFTILCQLIPTNGQLTVTLSGPAASIPSGLEYPYAFSAAGQSNAGWAVIPIDGGFVVPVSATNLQSQFTALDDRFMEWFGP